MNILKSLSVDESISFIGTLILMKTNSNFESIGMAETVKDTLIDNLKNNEPLKEKLSKGGKQ